MNMDLRKAFDQGLVAGIFLMLGIDAIYWFISAWTPEVSVVKTILVIIQFIVGMGLAAWFLFRRVRFSNTA